MAVLMSQLLSWAENSLGPASGLLKKLMDASIPVVTETAAAVGSTASQIWLWGQGTRPQLPSFAVSGQLLSAVDLVRGLGVLADLEVLDVLGASAGFNNDYRAQREACLELLKSRDFFLLHLEATDESGHQGEVAEKIKALELWD